MEPVTADGDDLLLLRVQGHTRGAGKADARPLEDRAGRDVAVVVRAVDGDEAHLIEAPRIAVVVLVDLLLRREPWPGLLEDVRFHLLHARVLLREEDVAGPRIDRHLAKMRQLRVGSADESFRRDVAVREPIEHEEAGVLAVALAPR